MGRYGERIHTQPPSHMKDPWAEKRPGFSPIQRVSFFPFSSGVGKRRCKVRLGNLGGGIARSLETPILVLEAGLARLLPLFFFFFLAKGVACMVVSGQVKLFLADGACIYWEPRWSQGGLCVTFVSTSFEAGEEFKLRFHGYDYHMIIVRWLQ